MFNKKYLYIKTLYEEGNITKASEKLYLSQPALSTYLKRLENELGCTLFERAKTGLKITDAGLFYLDYLQKIKNLNDDLEIFLQKKDTKDFPNKINFGITPWVGAYVTSDISLKFAKIFPNIDLNFIEGEGYVLKELYENNKIDCFVSIDVISDYMDMKSTEKLELRDDLILVVAPKSILGNKYDDAMLTCKLDNPLKFDANEIKNKKIITGQNTQVLHTCITRIIKNYKLHPKSFMHFRNINNILELVKSGQGITFIPKYYIKKGPKMDNCIFFTEDNELFHYRRMLFCRKDKYTEFYKQFGELVLEDIFSNLS